jgi:hypothetical protein|tara:strand:- start:10328 stop:10789 length:462 start_codon:yes stop_codon:yes gene_type:complete
MNFPITFFINASGLFDFDFTFPTEALLFLILAGVVTTVFLSPVSQQMDERAEFINYTLRKSTILLTFGYEKLTTCVGLLTDEIDEMNRQIKLVRNYTNSKFEEEITLVQKENTNILSQLKGDLSIKSAYLFSNVTNDLISLTDKFFTKKFQST